MRSHGGRRLEIFKKTLVLRAAARNMSASLDAKPRSNQTGGEKHMALSKSQTAAKLAEAVGITKKQAAAFFEALAALAYKEAKNSFVIPGLGKLVLVQRKARMGRNPATGEAIKIPAKKVVKFRVAKAAKDAILGGKK
jgi:DNA-binding protein HU-beta